MRRKSIPVLPTALLFVCIGLLWAVYQEMGANSRPIALPDSGAAKSVPALPAVMRYELAPIDRFSATVERPLFVATRRPPGTEAAPTAPVVEQPLDLVLKGVIVSGRGGIAILSETSGRGTLTMAQGKQYKGWTLAEILPDRLIFRRGNQERTLALLYDRAPAKKPSRKQRRNRRSRDSSEPTNEQKTAEEPTAKRRSGKRRTAE